MSSYGMRGRRNSAHSDDHDADPNTVKPTPDPTVLTTDAIALANQALRDYIDARHEVVLVRLAGMDEATKVLSDTVNRFPTTMDREITHLRERLDQYMVSVEAKFGDRDIRVDREAQTARTAIEAALAAQKEAVARQEASNAMAISKAEAATIESISKLADVFTSNNASLINAQADLKERINRFESVKQGGSEKMTGIYAALAGVVAIMTLVVMAANGLFSK